MELLVSAHQVLSIPLSTVVHRGPARSDAPKQVRWFGPRRARTPAQRLQPRPRHRTGAYHHGRARWDMLNPQKRKLNHQAAAAAGALEWKPGRGAGSRSSPFFLVYSISGSIQEGTSQWCTGQRLNSRAPIASSRGPRNLVCACRLSRFSHPSLWDNLVRGGGSGRKGWARGVSSRQFGCTLNLKAVGVDVE